MAAPGTSPSEGFDFFTAEETNPGIVRFGAIPFDVREPSSARPPAGTESDTNASRPVLLELLKQRIFGVSLKTPRFAYRLLSILVGPCEQRDRPEPRTE